MQQSVSGLNAEYLSRLRQVWRVPICKGSTSIRKGSIIHGSSTGGGIYIIDSAPLPCLCIWCFDGKNSAGTGIRQCGRSDADTSDVRIFREVDRGGFKATTPLASLTTTTAERCRSLLLRQGNWTRK